MGPLEKLARVYEEAKRDPTFWAELDALLKDSVGRPSPITEAPRLAAQVGSVDVALPNEIDLLPLGDDLPICDFRGGVGGRVADVVALGVSAGRVHVHGAGPRDAAG